MIQQDNDSLPFFYLDVDDFTIGGGGVKQWARENGFHYASSARRLREVQGAA